MTLIITSFIDAIDNISVPEHSMCICADGGYIRAKELNISPDMLIGDYDSSAMPDAPAIMLPRVKDMTDSEAAVDFAVSHGTRNIVVLGGLGGRLDHTMGNIGMLAKYAGSDCRLAFMDGINFVYMLTPGAHIIKKTVYRNTYRYLGLISYGGKVNGLTVRGCKYTLTNHILRDDTSLGVSNEILEDEAHLSFTDGKLLVILSSDISSSDIDK